MLVQSKANFMAEKSINEISRDLRVLFTKGNEAAQRENFDYAIALFNQVLEKEPGFFECRKALRDAQFRKAGDGGSGFFKRMLSGAGSSPQVAKAKMAMSKNPAEALVIAEQILNGDPNSSAAHHLIVEAAQALDLPQHGRAVARNPVEKFAQGQRSGDRICRGARRQRRRCQPRGTNPQRPPARAPRRWRTVEGVEKPVGAQDDGQGRLQLAGGRAGFVSRHFEEQTGSRFARTGKARREGRGRGRTAHRRIRGAPGNRTEKPQARPLARGALHAEKTVRPRPGAL